MFCPVCKDVRLAMSEKQGVEIDYCPQCRGVWLDRGELDKIIEKSGATQMAQQSAPMPQKHPEHAYPSREYKDHKYQEHQYGGHHKHKKKDSFLSDLFDF